MTGLASPTTLVNRLGEAGVLAALARMGLDVENIGQSLSFTRHHYERYRWSVALGDGFREVVHAVPPEEELGWTPWERWTTDDAGHASHRCWVAAPSRDERRFAWRPMDDPRAVASTPLFGGAQDDLRQRFELGGVRDAFGILGIDPDGLLAALGPEQLLRYTACRWVVIPHFLADDGPVVYSLPAADGPVGGPWETWYSAEGETVHHVHADRPRPGLTEEWSEPVGAPQRPPEVLGGTWFWGDPGSLDLAMT